MDDLPSATAVRDPETGELHSDYKSGIPVGKLVYDETGTNYRYILYNNWNIIITHAPVDDSLHKRIIAFTVEPRSLGNGAVADYFYTKQPPLYLDELRKYPEGSEERKFSFTYTVISRNDEVF